MSKPVPGSSLRAQGREKKPKSAGMGVVPESRSRVTLRDVAKEARVSVMTVSNVINGRADRVSDTTWKTVVDAIARLNYRPDIRARGLRLAQDFVIGMIVVDPSPTFLTDSFTTYAVAGISNYMNERGYALSIQGVPGSRVADVPLLRSRQSDALCIMVSGDFESRREVYRQLAKANQPVVVLQEQVPDFLVDAMSVRQDDRGGGAMLARYLLSGGARTLLFLTEPNSWPALENREAGIRDAISEAGPDAHLSVHAVSSIGYDGIDAALADYLARHRLPDAVMCGNDRIALFVLTCLANRGVDVPERVKVTGFNAFDFERVTSPSLFTVQSPAYELGQIAAASVLQRLRQGHFAQRDVILSVRMESGMSA